MSLLLAWLSCTSSPPFTCHNLGSWFSKRGKLYFTKDIVDDSLVARNRKPKPIPKPEAKGAPKPAPKGKHVQLFKMRRKFGNGFYSTAPDAPDGQ